MINSTDYLKYINNKKTPFYSKEVVEEQIDRKKFFYTSKAEDEEWYDMIGNDWHYMLKKPIQMPDQGWKIHISANIIDAQSLLLKVSEFLIEKKISFKFLPSETDLKLTLSKNANRAESGKFITIYPKNDSEFCKLLEPLKTITQNFYEGPYILNDCPWKESNVYFRYGAFKEMKSLQNGKLVLSIKRPDGTYTEDQRIPKYVIPDFVKEPDYVTKNNTVPDEKIFSALEELHIKDAVHFSNSGGIYNGQYDNKVVVIKEGRPNIGLDQSDTDGFKRVLNEYKILKKLEDIPEVVNTFGYKVIWKHNYLIEEKIEGKTLMDYLAFNYPFPNDFSVEEYTKNTIEIIRQLIALVEKIHQKNIAIVDFQPKNIILEHPEKGVKVRMIDFESSEKLKEAYHPKLFTQDYSSFQSKTFEEGDWYSLYRISRSLFLPTSTTMINSEDLENRENSNIKIKFGDEIVKFLSNIKKICQAHAEIYHQSYFYDGKIEVPNLSYDIKNIKENIAGLKRGLINNLDFNSNNLILGDVKQEKSQLGHLNIANGDMGAIMALQRIKSNILNSSKFAKWLKNTKEEIELIVQSSSNCDTGLYTGLAGIALVLKDLHQDTAARNIMKYCNESQNDMDISIYSGISGLGFANLSLYSETGEALYKDKALSIAKDIVNRYNSQDIFVQTEYEGKFSLIYGWGGAALFLWKIGIIFDDKELMQSSMYIIDEIIVKRVVETDQGLSLSDKSRGIARVLPYLDTGFAGLALILIEINKDNSKMLTTDMRRVLNYVESDKGVFCTYLSCLFSGLAGMIVKANAVKINMGKDDSLDMFIKSINNFAVSVKENENIMPGIFGIKGSMDYETGITGTLLALIDIDSNSESWGSWFPLLKENSIHLFTNKKTIKK